MDRAEAGSKPSDAHGLWHVFWGPHTSEDALFGGAPNLKEYSSLDRGTLVAGLSDALLHQLEERLAPNKMDALPDQKWTQ